MALPLTPPSPDSAMEEQMDSLDDHVDTKDEDDIVSVSSTPPPLENTTTTSQYKLYCSDDAILLKLEAAGGGSTYSEEIHTQRCMWNSCQRRFPSNSDALVNHVNDEHVRVDKETDYTCRWQGCPRRGKAFNARYNADRGIQLRHCSRYKMLIHIRTHTNERPHRCRECGKSFSRLENLKIHHRSHTGEKPYSCPVEGCMKAYSNSSDRFKHTRTHFDDKPYVCKRLGCDKRYTDPSSLRKHMKTYGHYREDRDLLLPNNTLRTEVVIGGVRHSSKRGSSGSTELSAGELRQLQKSHFVINADSFESDDALLSAAAAAVFGSPFASAEKRADVAGTSASIRRCLVGGRMKLEDPSKCGHDSTKSHRCQASPLDLTVGQSDSRRSTSPGLIITGKWGFPIGSN